MSAPQMSSVGVVLTADIAVPEHERETRFYSRVLTTGVSPLWREDLSNRAGAPVIGLGERIPEYAHLPLQWMPHIQVADVAASVRSALASGGSEVMHHRNDQGESQWAVLLDPHGAAFGVIPVVPPEAATSTDDAPAPHVGRIVWLDLTVPDASSACDFYGSVVGWSTEEVEMEASGERYSDYALCTLDGTSVAGICHARGVNASVPPVWLIYLPVGDLQESLERVVAEGGEVVRATARTNGEPDHALIRDPVGVYLALAQD